MHVIIVNRNGVLDVPHLVKHDTTAQATFESIVGELIGEDMEDVDLNDDYALRTVNFYLRPMGIKISWFVDVEINGYKNKKQ